MVVLTLGPTRGGGGVDVTPHKRIKHQYLTFSVVKCQEMVMIKITEIVNAEKPLLRNYSVESLE